ncbi:MAG TPA: tyrosine--tRNA ligase [Solirubrobacterales bacterium]|nr:tyrosine--tRNA ligase [Solirubrobacterales bacterium]
MSELETLMRGAEEILPDGQLEKQLAEGDPLRVKLGIDPSTADIHLGHVVVLTKLAQFQEAGHTVVLIIGDLTALVGDPSGRDATRPVLTPEQIEDHAQTYQDQAFKVLDRGRTEVRRNSEWLDMPAQELFRLLGKTTVARLLEREDFTKRMKADQPISSLELIYPVLQGYDSVAIRSDVELGGTDQKFNLLFARDVQRAYDVPEQSIVTMPLLPGTDGKQKMSKSLGNYVGVTEPPEEMFGKLMSVPDEAMGTYYELLLGEEAPAGHPAEAKRALARRIVVRFHGDEAAREAEARFDTVHVARGVPDDIPEVSLGKADGVRAAGDGEVHLPALIAGIFEISSSEARRLIAQGGVKLDGESVDAARLDLPLDELSGRVLQVGKRRFARLLPP